jgi:hypothetical protein
MTALDLLDKVALRYWERQQRMLPLDEQFARVAKRTRTRYLDTWRRPTVHKTVKVFKPDFSGVQCVVFASRPVTRTNEFYYTAFGDVVPGGKW